MRIAIAGKGGTGKTTISGTLARAMARRNRSVLAIDADSNPNLAIILGIRPGEGTDMLSLPADLLERVSEADGVTRTVFRDNPDDVIARYGVDAPDGVRLVVMGKVGHGGKG